MKHTVLSASQTLSDSWTGATGPAFLAANLKIPDLITPPDGEPMQAAKTIFIWLLCGEKFWQLYCKALDAALIVLTVLSGWI